MAWQSSGASNTALIENLKRNGLIVSERVKKAMIRPPTEVHVPNYVRPLQVDRANYSPALPYEDSPQLIGHRATISAPHMHADACEKLLSFLVPGAKVLDIGSGSGYLTHVFAELIKPGGKVIGVDHLQPLVNLATTNMAKSEDGRDMLRSGAVQFVKADGRQGFDVSKPYDAIHVGAAASDHHQVLVAQLKAPGRLFMPVEEAGGQYIYVTDKKADGSLERQKLYGVRYVPLTSEASDDM
ncbi:hypothetical protein FH972_026225 [Carpinus fangiana]|uniref:protein-L-isoaspartate(D-aspartate) O-methyltransferase n=1 Tax=Carpinus fangiana TaxID=176857 RepID=A0A5N6L4C8_9ROSI|nr:hypothetical protein FH972_026225 [Carpinus fangiana]